MPYLSLFFYPEKCCAPLRELCGSVCRHSLHAKIFSALKNNLPKEARTIKVVERATVKEKQQSRDKEAEWELTFRNLSSFIFFHLFKDDVIPCSNALL